MTHAWAIVVAAGSGSRFGNVKQYELLGDRRVLDWAVLAARSTCQGVVLVVPPGRGGLREEAADVTVEGGATRSDSVRAGLAAVPPEAEVIVVHDAARPLAPAALFSAVIAAVVVGGADGAVPGIPVADTVKRVDGDRVLETLDRSSLVAVQTPQAFVAAALRRAHAAGAEASDDAALVEAVGGSVVVVPGDVRNRKLTTVDDLFAARALLKAIAGGGARASADPSPELGSRAGAPQAP